MGYSLHELTLKLSMKVVGKIVQLVMWCSKIINMALYNGLLCHILSKGTTVLTKVDKQKSKFDRNDSLID
jgi:hypothetical protein